MALEHDGKRFGFARQFRRQFHGRGHHLADWGRFRVEFTQREAPHYVALGKDTGDDAVGVDDRNGAHVMFEHLADRFSSSRLRRDGRRILFADGKQ